MSDLNIILVVFTILMGIASVIAIYQFFSGRQTYPIPPFAASSGTTPSSAPLFTLPAGGVRTQEVTR